MEEVRWICSNHFFIKLDVLSIITGNKKAENSRKVLKNMQDWTKFMG